MNEPHSDLPAKHTVLRSFAGHLEAAPDDVYAVLVSWLRSGDDASGHLLTDANARFVVIEDGWWYRAEYRVRPEVEQASDQGAGVESESESDDANDADNANDSDSSDATIGSVVEFEIINVAQTAHWAAAFAARSVVRNAPAAFGRLLTELSEELEAEE